VYGEISKSYKLISIQCGDPFLSIIFPCTHFSNIRLIRYNLGCGAKILSIGLHIRLSVDNEMAYQIRLYGNNCQHWQR
jgi:hypothetical protein